MLLVDTYHHLGDPVRYFSALKQGLAPQGRVAIKKEFGRAGYKLADEHLFLPNQYFLVFSPN